MSHAWDNVEQCETYGTTRYIELGNELVVFNFVFKVTQYIVLFTEAPSYCLSTFQHPYPVPPSLIRENQLELFEPASLRLAT